MTAQQTVREYGNPKSMDRAVGEMSEQGWEVVSTVPKVRRQAWKLLLCGFGWLFWPTTGFVVIYRKGE